MIAPESVAHRRPGRRPEVSMVWPLLLAGLGGWWLVTRAAGIRLGLWWDEAYTAQRYVREGPGSLLDPDAYVANNHVLFSALTWASTRITGEADPWLRSWAILPAAVATVVLVGWLWRRSGPVVASFAMVMTVTSTLWLSMSIQARGYGLVVLAGTVLLVVVVHEDRTPTWGGDLLVAGGGLVAMATFPPTVALYLAHTGVWLLRRRTARIRLVALTAVVGVLTALLYLPLMAMLFERADRVGSRFADPISWWSPVIAPLQLVGGPSFGVGTGLGTVTSSDVTAAIGAVEIGLGVGTLPGIVALLVGLLGLALVVARLDRPLGWHLIAGLGGSIVLLAPAGFHLADRYIAFLLPHVTVALAFGLAGLCGAFAAEPRGRTPAVAAVLAVGLAVASAPVVWQAATTPLQAFAPAAEAIRDEPDATILVDNYHIGYRWYLDDLEVERVTDQAELDARLCDPQGLVFFAPDPDRPVLQVPSCLGPESERRFFHQREPGFLNLWVARPERGG